MCTDIIKQARGWDSIGQISTDTAPRDANGWPTTDVQTICIIGNAAWNLGGTYKLTMNGQATIAPLSCTATVTNQVYNSGTNTTTADFNLATGQTQLWIQFTNTKRTSGSATNTGFTNLKVIRPGYPADGSQPFTSTAITAVSKFQVFRCMDAQNTNNNTQTYPATTSWAQRVPATYAFQGNSNVNHDSRSTGMSYEMLIQLANICNNDIWINVPVSATDDYVTQLATLLKNTLHSGGHVYVELGNEDWNGQFPQTAYMQAWGNATGAGWFGQVGNRVAQISNLFKAVYGAAAINTTVRVVLAGQHTNSGTLTQAADYIAAHYGPVNTIIYGTATGGYYSANATTNSVAAVLNSLTAASSSEISKRQGDINVAHTYGVQPMIYEGGPDLSTDNAVPQATLDASARDSGMTAIMVNDLNNNWFGIGGGLYMHFNIADDYGGGDWGLSEFGGDLGTAKWAAINQVLGATGSVPGTPGTLTATSGNAQVSLNWGAASGATSYNVYRGTTAGGESTTAIATGIATTTFTNTGLTNGATYFYKVAGVNATGTGAKGNEASATPTAPSQVQVVNGTPVIDGNNTDAVWTGAASYQATKVIGTISGGSDLSVSFKAAWDTTNFYVLVDVTDDVKKNDSTNAWDDDAVELFLDADHNGGTSYDANDRQIVCGWGDAAPVEGGGRAISGVSFAKADPSGTTYRIEAKIPWAVEAFTPANNAIIGMDVHVDDDDDGGARDGKLAWNDGTDQAWANPSLFGTGKLLPAGGSIPGTPGTLTATAGNTQAALSWGAASGATSYNVYRGTTAGGESGTPIATGIAATTYTNTGLTNGTTYFYKVAGVNATGTGAQGNEASATPTAGVNLALNPGFETGSTSSWNWSGGTVGVSTTSPHSGTYTGYEAGGFADIGQIVTGLASNHTYTLTCWAKLSATTGSSIVLEATSFGGTTVTKPITTTSWAQYSLTFTTGASNTQATIEVADVNGSAITCYCDDFTLQ